MIVHYFYLKLINRWNDIVFKSEGVCMEVIRRVEDAAQRKVVPKSELEKSLLTQ